MRRETPSWFAESGTRAMNSANLQLPLRCGVSAEPRQLFLQVMAALRQSVATARFVGFALILSMTPLAHADDSATAFDQANRLHEEGKYAEAAAVYEQILQSGQVSPAVHFNLGNSYFKAGQLGRAILNYRAAARLSPRDADVRQNLEFARSRVGEEAPSGLGWLRWTQMLSLNELAVLCLLAWWAWMGLLAYGQFFPPKRDFIRKYAWSASGLTIAFAIWLWWAWYDQVGSRPAVVIAKEAVIRLGPFEESQSDFVLHDGAEVNVKSVKDNWVRVEDFAGRRGWLRVGQIGILNGS